MRMVSNIRIAQYRNMDISNGEDVGIAIYVQGCHFHCKNCFNTDTWDFDKGAPYNTFFLAKILKDANKEYINRISILGGEPLADENFDGVLDICSNVKSICNKPIWLYSGYTYEAVVNSPMSDILDYIDVLVDGRYIDGLRDLNLAFRGSSNQRIIDITKSTIDNIILKEV